MSGFSMPTISIAEKNANCKEVSNYVRDDRFWKEHTIFLELVLAMFIKDVNVDICIFFTKAFG